MPRHNKRKAFKKKDYKKKTPDTVKQNSKPQKSAKKEADISPPELAISDMDSYGVVVPEAVQQTQEAPVSDAPLVLVNNPNPMQKEKGGKLTVAIVDYEHWFYSMWGEYGIRPNIEEWFERISDNRLLDIKVYADFSKEDIFKELPRIRHFTNTIVDTRSPNARVEKDLTDFIVLNELYQLAWRRGDIEKVVLLTGDGHFSPAVSFLRTVCGMEVEVYGVRGCINTNLRLSASTIHELPGSLAYLLPCAERVFEYIDKVRKEAPWYNFCFVPLAEQVSTCYGYSLQIVKDTIETLIRQDYIRRESKYVNSQEKTVLAVDWDAVANAGLAPESDIDTSVEPPSTFDAGHKRRKPYSRKKLLTNELEDAIYDAAEDEGDDELNDEKESAIGSVEAYIKAQMDDDDKRSDLNATEFMAYYKRNAM